MNEQKGEEPVAQQPRAVHEFGGETLEGVAPTIQSGDVAFGRYRLERILGVGGMGVVWLAKDEKLDQHVALKFVPETLRHDESAIDDLKKQTKIGLKLSHPNIVRVASFEEDGDLAGIVMEYVDGPTLAAMRIDQPAQVFEADTLHTYAAQLLDALEYAHTSAAMVHRDLKPANLMVNASDQVKVTDFGIACSIRDSVSRMTQQPKAGSGTLLYMSPQQMMGTPPSESDDIYSLGVTLFELMTGAPPFYTGDVQTQVRDIAAPSVADRRAQEGIEGEPVPEHWETVIAACLAKEPAQRPSSVAEVRKGLAGKKFTRGPRGRKPAAAAVGPTPTEIAMAPPAGAAPRGRLVAMVGGAAALIAAGFFIVTSGGKDDGSPPPP